MSDTTEKTRHSRALFLEHLRQSANVTASADFALVDRSTVYRWREEDAAFALAWADTLEAATDALEAEARRRAMDGVEEYLTGKDGLIRDSDGRPVMQRRYSDTLMVQLLRAHRPDKFRDRSTVDLNVGDLAALIEEGRKRARGEGS